MNFSAFFKELKQGDLPQITVFNGPEIYLVDHTVKFIHTSFLNRDYETFNYNLYEGALDIESMLMQTDTMPFFDERRIAVFYKTGILKSIKDEAESKFASLIKDMPHYLHLVFYEPDMDMRKSINKTLKKVATYVEVPKYTKPELVKWVAKQFKDLEKEVSTSVVNYFVDRMDYLEEASEKNLYDVSNAIKILSQSDGPVEIKLIDEQIKLPIEHNIFKMTDAVSEKQMGLALKIMGDFLNSGEHPIMILGLLASQYRNIYKVKMLLEAGYDSKTAASKLDIHPFVAKKAAYNASKYTSVQLEEILKILSETDMHLKSTGLEGQWLLEKALFSIELL